jgi:cellulose synthase/poly-beta-1,6-N-acetylglucosamine synthase-like glycosyltransferase
MEESFGVYASFSGGLILKSFSVIIPIHRDVAYSKAKIANILSLQYHSQMVEVIISHGGAKSDRIQTISEGDPLVRVLHRKGSGKTLQINEALKEAYGDIVVITDVDALMEPNCLRELGKAFEDPQVAAAGVWTYPQNCTLVDRIYWYIANWLRILEGRIQTTSHVSGCCLAFRKDLISQLPEDVIADDVYIPFLANFQGKRTVYLRTTKVAEVRQPRSVGSFMMHKTRKGRAVLRELLRFLYLLYKASFRWKVIYFARLIQFTLLTPSVFLSYFFTNDNSNFKKVNNGKV